MILDLDFGNTSGKWRVVDGDTAVSVGHFFYADLQIFMQGLSEKIHRIRVVSVLSGDHQQRLFQQIEKFFSLSVECAVVTSQACGLTNGYDNPQHLGADRWVAIVAAWKKFTTTCVVVDAGSALTIDCIDECGQHYGGFILPGLTLMRDALNSKAGKISLDAIESGISPGVNTSQAVGHGCLLALISAIKSAYAQFAQSSKISPLLIITGGDAKTLLPYLPSDSIYVPDLVFEGLALVLP